MGLPVHEHQVVPEQRTLGLWPEDADQAAGVQTLVHVEGVGKLVHCLKEGDTITRLGLCN